MYNSEKVSTSNLFIIRKPKTIRFWTRWVV